MSDNITPQQDTGWGLIFRLNALFNEVEDLAPLGKYHEWNLKLDRIWSNLLYRNELEFTKNKDKEIVGIKFDDEDIKEKEYLDNQILKAKSMITSARKLISNKNNAKVKESIKAKRALYRSMLVKDIWLRKFMYKLGLYLKENKYNPAGAMWGK